MSSNPSSAAARQESAYEKGVLTGFLGCIGMIVLSVVGLVGGYSLAGMAHESEWFMTKAEFVERHGKSDAGLVAFGNFVSAGLAGAVILPVGGLIVFSLLPGRSVRPAPLPRKDGECP